MVYQLNEKIRDLVPYEPISGEYRIRLDANESFLEIPEYVKEDMLARIAKLHLNRYPDPLASGVCEGFGKYFGVSPDLLTVGNGSDELLTLLTQVMMMKGETLVTTTPDFSMYLPREEVLRLVEGVPECLVVADEAYMEFWSQSVMDCVERYDNLMVLKTCSKSFRMAGIRCGIAVANRRITNALRAAKSPYNVNSMTQAAAETLFDYPRDLDSATAKVIASRDELYASVKALADQYPDKLSLLPTTANFVYIQMPDGEAKRVFEAMKEEGVVVRLMGDHLRITCGTEQENAEVLRLLEANV